MPYEAKMNVSDKKVIKHPGLGHASITYDPSDVDCFSVWVGGGLFTSDDLEKLAELCSAALAYHKLSQEEQGNARTHPQTG